MDSSNIGRELDHCPEFSGNTVSWTLSNNHCPEFSGNTVSWTLSNNHCPEFSGNTVSWTLSNNQSINQLDTLSFKFNTESKNIRM